MKIIHIKMSGSTYFLKMNESWLCGLICVTSCHAKIAKYYDDGAYLNRKMIAFIAFWVVVFGF